jgi:ArsR family transcriptional regulator
MYDVHMTTRRPVPLGSRPLTDPQAVGLASVFGALSDPVRLRLFDLVRRAGADGVCSCDLVEPLDRSQPTISHHLKVLREAGLVESRKEGTWVWYSATENAMEIVSRFASR